MTAKTPLTYTSGVALMTAKTPLTYSSGLALMTAKTPLTYSSGVALITAKTPLTYSSEVALMTPKTPLTCSSGVAQSLYQASSLVWGGMVLSRCPQKKFLSRITFYQIRENTLRSSLNAQHTISLGTLGKVPMINSKIRS